MRDDLLDALAAVDWAKSCFPAFQQRINAWLEANYTVRIEESPTDATHDLIIARAEFLPPLAFNAEAGAYINTIRSGLDILAWALAMREPEPFLHKDKIYFPVANSAAQFASGDYKGSEFVRQLSGTARKVLESHQPYKGGNVALYALHQFDITRKHKRLLATDTRGSSMTLGAFGFDRHFIPNEGGGFVQTGKNETVLGKWAKGVPYPQVHLEGQIVFDEEWLPGRKRVIGMLNIFADTATTIIKSFDY